MPLAMPLFICIAILFAVTEGLRARRQSNKVSYTFDEFVQDYGRIYEVGSEEHARRAAVFEQSLAQIHAINSRGDSSWTAGMYAFMDWTGAERAARLHGYDPSVGSWRVQFHRERAVTLQADTATATRYGGPGDNFEVETPAVRNQGGLCGSCWAFSAVEAVEAQLMKSGAWKWEGAPRLSVQALLDCMPNPRHCGGKGGCDGATPEFAFEFMQSSGLPLERDSPYRPTQTGTCPIEPFPSDWVRVTLAGWRALPSNRAQPLMQALVQEGPVVVAADAHDWYPYQRGIFDGCSKDAIPNHSALAKGYGTDGVDGEKVRMYWLLQNSWGLQWGEQGTIRLLRRDNEDHWCGSDSHPEEGSGCEDEPRRNVTVCGSCGLLYDPVIPHVGHVEVQPSDDSQAPASASIAIADLAVLPVRNLATKEQTVKQDQSVESALTVGVDDISSTPKFAAQLSTGKHMKHASTWLLNMSRATPQPASSHPADSSPAEAVHSQIELVLPSNSGQTKLSNFETVSSVLYTKGLLSQDNASAPHADRLASHADARLPGWQGSFSQTASKSSDHISRSPGAADGHVRLSDSQTLVETVSGSSAEDDRGHGVAAIGGNSTPIASSIAGRVQEVILETEGSDRTAIAGLLEPFRMDIEASFS